MGKHELKKKANVKKVLLIIFIVFVILQLLRVVLNSLCSLSLTKYIQSFEAVEYDSSRVVPAIDESTGHYSIVNKDGLKVMMLNDLHIGGGPYTIKKDKKTIYEVITMLQAEKPDLVVLVGDNVFCTPGPIFNGGGTFINKMAQRVVMEIFEHEQVYYSVVFGNHDTEGFDRSGRIEIGELFESGKSSGGTNNYCIFKSEYSEDVRKNPTVTNQFIELIDEDGNIEKLILMLDTNDYVSRSIMASINWEYDTIHDTQVEWAKNEIIRLSEYAGLSEDTYLPVVTFFHIPIGEYQSAYLDLESNNFNDTKTTKYLEGVWDEEISEELGIRIWFGGCSEYAENPNDADKFFEVLGPDGLNVLEACFCGHDHVNNAAVEYRGVQLVYNYSLDNTAYTGIEYSGLQRGCGIINFDKDCNMTWQHKNVYQDYGASTDKFFEVYLDHLFYDGAAPKSN